MAKNETQGNNDRKFRTRDRIELLGVRVAVVGEPKEINDTTTLCEFKVVSQSGDERYPDTWVTVTGANGLAEKIYGLNKGDRVNVAGKPYFRAWKNGEGEPQVSVEIRFPEFVDVVARADGATKADAAPKAAAKVVEETEEEDEEEKPAKKAAPKSKLSIKSKGKTKAAELFDEDDEDSEDDEE